MYNAVPAKVWRLLLYIVHAHSLNIYFWVCRSKRHKLMKCTRVNHYTVQLEIIDVMW